MVAHDLGGGVRRHIDSLVTRFRDQARFLLLAATDRGAALSVPSLPHHPSLALPEDRLDDLVADAAIDERVAGAYPPPARHGYGYPRADPPPGRAVRRDRARLLRDLSADQPAALAAQPVLWGAGYRRLQRLHRAPKFARRPRHRDLARRPCLAVQGGRPGPLPQPGCAVTAAAARTGRQRRPGAARSGRGRPLATACHAARAAAN